MDIVIVSEPNKRTCTRNVWLADDRLDATMVFVNNNIAVHNSGKSEGFVWAELLEAVIYSCYCSPNVDLQHFEIFITELDRDIRSKNKQVVVGRGGLQHEGDRMGIPHGRQEKKSDNGLGELWKLGSPQLRK